MLLSAVFHVCVWYCHFYVWSVCRRIVIVASFLAVLALNWTASSGVDTIKVLIYVSVQLISIRWRGTMWLRTLMATVSVNSFNETIQQKSGAGVPALLLNNWRGIVKEDVLVHLSYCWVTPSLNPKGPFQMFPQQPAASVTRKTPTHATVDFYSLSSIQMRALLWFSGLFPLFLLTCGQIINCVSALWKLCFLLINCEHSFTSCVLGWPM